MADHDSACDTYTLVLRFRNEAINPIRGNQNRVIQVGAVWTSASGAAAGFDFRMAPQETLGNISSPRIVVGTNQQEFQNIRIQDGKWVDCAIAVSRQTLAATFCWEDGNSNVIARASYTYPTSAALPAIAANCTVRIGGAEKASCTFTRGVEISSSNWTYGFRGAFHQIAFWDRTLSDDEIREAMAGGTSRPNLVQVGIEGNGINEFATSSQTANVATDGAWEYLNPTLTSENPTATISFTCPALWAGLPQHLRLPMASTSSSGLVSVALNGETLGTVDVAANKTAFLFIEGGKILSGSNTLAISRASGDSLVLDAVTLGGSWRFGNAISSFSDSRDQYEPWVRSSPDRYVFNSSCGSDKFHDRSMNTSGDAKTYFSFFVPADMVGKFRGVFTTRTQNTGGSSMPYSFHVNGAKVGDFTLKGGTETTVKISDDFIVSGWNTAYWTTTSGGYWANIDWHKFELLPPPKGMIISIR